MASVTEIKLENATFDEYGQIREGKRSKMLELYGSGATGKSDAAVHKFGVDSATDIPAPYSPVAMRKFVTEDGEVFYLGDVMLGENADGDFLMSWHSPMAKEFMKSSPVSPGRVAEYRVFKPANHANAIVDFTEEKLAEQKKKFEKKVKELTETGLSVEEAKELAEIQVHDELLEELMNARAPEMQSIVRTMQAMQYRIVEAPTRLMMVIQGGPGTGKTAIALHRLAYLIHNTEGLSPEDVLFVGPNNDFYSYIKQLIPTIGQVPVEYVTPAELCSVPAKLDHEIDSPLVSRIKERDEMGELISRALWQRIKVPSDSVEVGPYRLELSEIENFIDDARKSNSYNNGRARLRTLIENYFVGNRFSEPVPPQRLDSVVQSIWPRLTPAEFLRDLYSSKERLLNAANHNFTALDIQHLHRDSTEKISEQHWSLADLALLDHASALIGTEIRRYKYIVVDEAQDLTPMQRLSIGRRSADGSMTLLGDLAQSSLPNGVRSWTELVDAINSVIREPIAAQIEQLDIAYRLPSGIVNYLNDHEFLLYLEPDVPKLKAVRNTGDAFFMWSRDGSDMTEKEDLDFDSLVAWASSAVSDITVDKTYTEHRSIALITPFEFDEEQVAQIKIETGVHAIHSPLTSKGLEFDYVLVAHADLMAESSDFGYQELFIAVTRATQRVDVLTSNGEFPVPYETELPDDVEIPVAIESKSSSIKSDLHAFVTNEVVEIIRETVPRSNWGKILLDVQNSLERDEN